MVRVDKARIISAQTAELRAIKSEMDSNPGEFLESVMQRRPKWIGWIDENGKVRESPREGGVIAL